MRKMWTKSGVMIGLILLVIAGTAISAMLLPSKNSLLDDSETVEFDGNFLLGKPTLSTMSLKVIPNQTLTIKVIYGLLNQDIRTETKSITVEAASSPTITMTGLEADSAYVYRLAFKKQEALTYSVTSAYEFHTPRSEGSDFNFVIQSDSHLLNKADQTLYMENMLAMNQLNPDFFFDLGDTFLNDQAKELTKVTQAMVDSTYLQQLPFLSVVAREAPLFLTIGNHEGEFGSFLKNSTDNIAAYSTRSRAKYMLNPTPNEFYTGNQENEESFGSVGNYYAFSWGDALFVSIDPYRYSMVAPTAKDSEVSKDGWAWTLGETQYDWFRSTLENSTAKFKFVFSHHALGNFRGGSEMASLYEWGGYDPQGNYRFDQERPGWGKPIQKIMEDTGVTLFFQGHDHLFSKEEVNGVVYVTLPKPAETVADQQNNFSSYQNGDTLMNSGYLNVSVSASAVQVDYLRTYFMGAKTSSEQTGLVYRFTVDVDHQVNVLKTTQDDLSTYGQNQAIATTDLDLSSLSMTPVPEGGFAFEIQADSHLDENTDKALYKNTLELMVQSAPSFVIDLGDTFMSEKYAASEDEVKQRYLEARSYFDLLGDVPLYLVTGNHDGETGFDPTLRAQALHWRQTYFPQTQPILSGNTQTANYFAFTQNNALFVILDPYTFTLDRISSDGWNGTLGKTQYDWLQDTLKHSSAPFKFIFIHALIAGNGDNERGGIEAASYFEWGGYSLDGTYDFDEERPGWGKPIHELLVEYGVTAVFHGHDHFFAQQTLDGITYQLVPQPATAGSSVNHAEDYGYLSGNLFPSAGFLRVVVSQTEVTVEYVKTDSKTVEIPTIYKISSAD